MAKAKTPTVKANPFNAISENLPFWPDRSEAEHKPFTGVLVDDSIILGDKPDPKDNVPVFIFADADTGEKYFIIKSYAIEKAVKVVKDKKLDIDNIVFNFIFKGKTEANGKPFNQFDTSYCTLAEYEAFKQAE